MNEMVRPYVPKEPDIVRMLLVRFAEGQQGPDAAPSVDTLDLTAVQYDLNAGPLTGATTAENVPNALPVFVDSVIQDMDELNYSVIMDYAEQQANSETREANHLVFIRLLKSFGDKPVELLGNMLATFLVAAVDDMLMSPDFPSMLEAWKATPSKGQE
jgi:hypothetical protein